MLHTPPRAHPSEEATRRAQDPVATLLRALARIPLLQGRLVDPLVLPAGTYTNINHGLGRKPQGWFLVSPLGDARVWEDQAYTGQDRTKVLRLQASGALVTSIWVF